jgi:hypothetical protein
MHEFKEIEIWLVLVPPAFLQSYPRQVEISIHPQIIENEYRATKPKSGSTRIQGNEDMFVARVKWGKREPFYIHASIVISNQSAQWIFRKNILIPLDFNQPNLTVELKDFERYELFPGNHSSMVA